MIQLLAAMSAVGHSQNPPLAMSADTSTPGFAGLLDQAMVADGVQLAAGAGAAGAFAQSSSDQAADGVPADEALRDEVSAFLAMLGLPVPVDLSLAPAGQLAKVSGEDGAATAAVLQDDAAAAGKKLPNQQAVLAGQKALDPALADPATDVTVAAESDPAPVIRVFEPSSPGVQTGTGASKDALASPSVANPVAGPEAALALARGQTGQDRAVASMHAGFGTTAWTHELGDKLVWLAGRQGQMAELVLTPPSLGTVEVRLNLNGAEASAQFFAANPQVRDALEAALPRLRELMGNAGIALGDTSVSDQSLAQRDRAPQDSSATLPSGAATTLALDGAQSAGVARVNATAMLDDFV